MKRAIGIVRVSQIEDGAQSPETQALRIAEHCLRNGWELRPDDILNENDAGHGRLRNVSGGASLADRPGLGPAVEMVERGDAHVIVAGYFDRLFRDLDVQREVIERVRAAGGRLETVDMGEVSHTTAMTEFSANIQGSVAQYIRRSTKEKSVAAVSQAIGQGRVPWHQTAPGYVRLPDSTLSPDSALAPIVVRAFELRRGGATIGAVRAYLAEHGVKRSYHGTQHLLRDRLYLGEIHFGARSNLAAHKPIVDRDLFADVQAVAAPRGPRPKSERLLARVGVLRCASCGGKLVVGTQRQHGRNYPFFKCPSVREDCPARVAISAELVERLVVDVVRAALADMEGRASAASHTREAEALLDSAQAALDSALRAFAGFEGESAARERLLELRSERDAAEERLAALGGARAVVSVTVDDWDRLSLDGRRDIIRATVQSATVAPGRGTDRVTVELFGE